METEKQDLSTIPEFIEICSPGSFVLFHGTWRWFPIGTTLQSTLVIKNSIELKQVIAVLVFCMPAIDVPETYIIGAATAHGLLQTTLNLTTFKLQLLNGFKMLELKQHSMCH